jgi:HAD superfamily phosphatase
MASKKLIVFDMDGVLVDPTKSYRQTVVETVASLGGSITLEAIEDYKNQGGWNNDWALTMQILADQQITVPYDEVRVAFNKLFHGPNGFVMQEEWLVSDGLLDRLGSRHQLGIFTGRLQADAAHTLNRFAPNTLFAPRVCAEDVVHGKPAPDGLIKIQQQHPEAEVIFLGDTVDDARSARLAGVPFYGIASANHLRRRDLIGLFEQEQAVAVLETVNEIEDYV